MTHTRRYPHNHSIIQGLRASTPLSGGERNKVKAQTLIVAKESSNFKIILVFFFPVRYCRESALWGVLLEGTEVGGLLLRECCAEIQLSL